MKINPLELNFTPLPGSTFTNLLRLLAQNKFRISIVGVPRTAYSLLLSALLSPLNIWEKIKFDKKIENVELKPPIFIIGHWRSGTTYLHNLLSQDKQFGYPSTFHTVVPSLFLNFEKWIKPIVEASLPPTRPEDNVPLAADLPQEEEYAMGNLCPYAFYNAWCFPKNMEFYYKFVCMENVESHVIKEWKEKYIYFLKKVAYHHKGKQLVLKNPANTARIKLLLEMFPEAKFIHIYRNPYHVFFSMKRDIEAEMSLYCVQKPKDDETIEKAMANLYIKMFEKYFREKELIPDGNLIEVRYEDFVSNPFKEIKRIYEGLKLKNFDKAKHVFLKFIEEQKKIKVHEYNISNEDKEKIYNYWNLTIDKWGYDI